MPQIGEPPLASIDHSLGDVIVDRPFEQSAKRRPDDNLQREERERSEEAASSAARSLAEVSRARSEGVATTRGLIQSRLPLPRRQLALRQYGGRRDVASGAMRARLTTLAQPVLLSLTSPSFR